MSGPGDYYASRDALIQAIFVAIGGSEMEGANTEGMNRDQKDSVAAAADNMLLNATMLGDEIISFLSSNSTTILAAAKNDAGEFVEEEVSVYVDQSGTVLE